MMQIAGKLKFNLGFLVNLILIFLGSFIFEFNLRVYAADEEFNDSINTEYLKKISGGDYILGSGDGLIIDISPNYPELRSSVSIDGEGYILLNTLGRIYISGLTTQELSSVLNKAFKNYVKFPNVSVQIINYRPIKVILEGEINDPGIKTLNGSIRFQTNTDLQIKNPLLSVKKDNNINEINHYFPTVFDAIRSGGGITRYSDLTKVRVIRRDSISNGNGKIATTLNINDVFLKNDLSQNIRIYDGDLIKIARTKNPNENILNAIRSDLNPKFIRIFVTGKVNSPGEKIVGKSSTLNDAIDISGGAKVLRGPITYLTFQKDGTVEKRGIKYRNNSKRGSKNNPYLKEGDLIYVGNSIYSNAAEAISEITSPFEGIYSTYRLIELIGGE
tara:strand:- start:1638 stop:2801 length:1164 start_codon:yes stop_codon:yes gene_type:complete